MGSPVDDALDRLPKDLREDVEYLRAVLVFATADAYSEKAALTALDRLTDDLATVRSALEQLREERDAARVGNRLVAEGQNELMEQVESAEAELQRLREERDTTTPLHALREKNRELRASLEAAEAEVERYREGLREAVDMIRFPCAECKPFIDKARALLADSPDGDCEHDYVFVYGFQSTEDFYRCDKCGVRSDDGVYPKVGAFHPHRPDGANTEGGEA